MVENDGFVMPRRSELQGYNVARSSIWNWLLCILMLKINILKF